MSSFAYNPFTDNLDYRRDQGGGGTVTSVSGTANRITSTGGATPVIDIASNYVGQASLTTLGTITTGTWHGSVIGPTFGGTGLNTYTTGDMLYASATNTLAKRAIGSTGNLLTVAGGLPTWAAPISFTQIVQQLITATGTYTPTAGMKFVKMELLGGGGGGGGSGSTGAAQMAAGGGGGGGGYAMGYLSASTIGASQSVTIGGGGAGGIGNNGGGTGGSTILGSSIISAGGGGGGGAGAATAGGSSSAGTGSGVGTSGSINVAGRPGGIAITYFVGSFGMSGVGGSSQYGSGGNAIALFGTASPSNGNAGTGYGGGGSGAGAGNNAAAANGGAGSSGVLLATEYI